MIKMVQLLLREEGLSHEEFKARWTGEHAEIAGQLPNLRKYVTSTPRDPEKASYDGIVELYFDSTEELAAAFESPEGERVQADATEFVDLEASPSLVVEETVQFDHIS
ncbi:EthD domain-containing protein [Halalkalicoccus subterraneus]|uniref:EthD domain-containing protein n=1 Tax=Halalkalicoccus subterraneus TaxID=2675002 RepID=UPI000EFB898D|nr:EthD domain-containing protein [Halalkalicoccus subterraneus]